MRWSLSLLVLLILILILIERKRNCKIFKRFKIVNFLITFKIGLWTRKSERDFSWWFQEIILLEAVACDRTWDLSLPFDNTLSGLEVLNLSLPFSNAEILFALNSVKAFKAPRLDGIHARFFQRFWMVVGDLVKFEVKRIFQNRKIPP